MEVTRRYVTDFAMLSSVITLTLDGLLMLAAPQVTGHA